MQISPWGRRIVVGALLLLLVVFFHLRSRNTAGVSQSRSGTIGQLRVGNASVQASELLALARASVPHYSASTSLEDAAILASKSQQATPRPQKGLLCAVFANANRASVQTILANIEYMKSSCDWALIFYGGDASLIRLLQHAVSGKEDISIIKCLMADPREHVLRQYSVNLFVTASQFHQPSAWRQEQHWEREHNSLVYPKSLLYMYLLDLLPAYERVWLLDSDISTVQFNVKEYLKTTNCAFPERPLVSQPLIAKSTQSYKYLNADEWRDNNIAATSSDFVEIQAPLMDSVFFVWFLRFFVVPLLLPSHILGADWGFDALFCNAARIFAHQNGRDSRYVCMIVTGGTPLRHLDTGAVDETLGYDLKKYLNKALMRIIEAAFPHVYHSGHDKSINPLLFSGNYFQVTANSSRFLNRRGSPQCAY